MTDGGTKQTHTAREHVGSLSRKNWTLRRMLAKVRKGADSPKPPQQRGLQGHSHTAESALTKSIRSNTSRRMKVWGKPVSGSATHLQGAMASPPLCIAILVVNENVAEHHSTPDEAGAVF